MDGYTYTVNLVALDEFGEITDAEPAVRLVYVRDIVQPRAPSMQLMSVRLPANPSSGTTSIDDFSVEFVAGGSTNSGAYIWNATRSTSGHQFVYMVSYSTSGVGISEPGALEIRIPLHMMKDRYGNYADTIEMSVPHEDEITDLDLMLGLTEYAYKIEGDEVVFFNVTEISAAVNGYFEVAYALNDPTFNYIDMGRSDEMRASISINTLTANDTDLPFGINTTAKINSTDKRFPTLYSSWQPSFGTAPADADDYFYLVWEVRSIIDDYITQPYSLEFTDIPLSDNGPVEVVGYKLSGQGGYSTNNIITESRSSGYRYDYILTRHPKSVFDPLDAYLIKNSISITLTPIDGLDAPTTVRSNRNFPWERPEFKYPTGHFMSYKRADGAYRSRLGTYLTELGMKAGKYTRYDLQEFSGRGGETIVKDTLDNFDYAVWTVGYPYPWTIADENKADWKEHPEFFGQVPVRYEQIDEGVFLYPDGGTVSTRELTSQDFEIDTLAYQVQIRDADYNPETCAFESKTGTFTASDILNIYTKATDNSNDWLLSATVNLLTGETNIERAAAIAEAPAATLLSGKTRGNITFGDNIIAYKLETSNAHYFSEIDSVPNMHLKNSAYVMETIAELDSIALRNTVKGTVYKTTDGSVIQTWTEADTDYACVTQRDSYLRKTVVSTENNKKYKYFGINWKIAMEETATFGEGTREYVTQSSGRFYDLLPDGMHVDTRTVAVQTEAGYLAENAYSVEVITNYKDSGRDLLIVNAEEEAQYYNLYFTTRIDWNGIKDYGEEIYNPAAYETGNDVIKYGTCDDGGTIEASDKALMTGLDEECTTNRFIYTGQHYDIAALTAATAGLTKHIKESGDPLYVYKTETVPNGEYSYRLRYMNTIRTRAKDLIFYDSLENYKINGETVGGGALAEEFTSDWHGTLTGVDVSQMIAMGAAPVIYLSSSENLVFLNNDVGNLPDLSNTEIWKKMEDFGDISNAKAIAIDI